MRKQLEALFIHDESFEKLEAEFENFCPFEAIGMVRQEIRHAHFLSYILDPNRPHAFGTACLKALMNAIAENGALSNGGTLTRLDVHFMALDSAIIKREWNRIDLLIEIPDEKLVIAIELKIDASESKTQLQRYRKRVEETWPGDEWQKLYLFVTTSAESPEYDREYWNALFYARNCLGNFHSRK